MQILSIYQLSYSYISSWVIAKQLYTIVIWLWLCLRELDHSVIDATRCVVLITKCYNSLKHPLTNIAFELLYIVVLLKWFCLKIEEKSCQGVLYKNVVLNNIIIRHHDNVEVKKFTSKMAFHNSDLFLLNINLDSNKVQRLIVKFLAVSSCFHKIS